MVRVFKIKKLKIIIALLSALILFLTFFTSLFTVSADAKDLLDERDKEIIENMIFEVAEQDGVNLEEFSYLINDVYYSNEEWAGYVIDFFSKTAVGYMIVFYTGESYALIEINFGYHSPYYGKDGLYIYPSLGYYFLKVDGEYVDAMSQTPIIGYQPPVEKIFYASCEKDKEGVEEVIDVSYYYGFLHKSEIENFYVRYEAGLTDDSNNCANAAGLIMLNYWNKKFDNDLLKLDNSVISDGNISFNSTRDARQEYMHLFYDYMNTNWFFGLGGTLPNNVYSGFIRLIEEQGYKTTLVKDLDYQTMISYIDDGIPIFITSKDYYFTTTTSLPTTEYPPGSHNLSITYEHTWGIENSHTFVGYGYAYYSLYDTGKDNYFEELIKIADGWGGSRYFNFNRSNKMSSGAINVYK